MAATVNPTHTTTQNEARLASQQYLNARLASGSSASAPPARPFTVPEIDISPSFSTSLDARRRVADKIREACTSSGFFHIVGHGVPESTRRAILDLAARYFKTVPREKKEALHVKNSPYFRGYEPSDFTYVNPDDWTTAAGVPETKEGFNWGYEPGLDPTGGDGLYRELDGAQVNGNVWPDEADVPGFYATIREYYGQVLALARHLFRLFALSLDLPETHFDHMMTHPGGIARMLYYPAKETGQDAGDGHQAATKQQSEAADTDQIGLGAHTDYECFTILLCSSASGLEILSPENRWVPAPAAEGSFVINVADFLMRWTNGVYKSTVHRVVNRTPNERFSVPFFFSINYDEMVETLPSCIAPDNPVRYAPIRAGEYILERLRATAKEG